MRYFLVGILVVAASASTAGAKTVVVTTTIQAAVNSAKPGDTVSVPPGTYRESVQVTANDITITGSRSAVIDATGFRTGIRVGKPGGFPFPIVNGVPVCPHVADPSRIINKFTLNGLTIQNSEATGVLLTGVRKYRLSGTSYLNNKVYGPFPVCSDGGVIEDNTVEGGVDAGIYVGDSDNATIRNNLVSRYAIGIEVENSTNVTVRDNVVRNNTVGIVVVVLPGLPKPLADEIRIEENEVIQNNFPNPIDPAAEPDNPVGLLPTGTGILNVGGDHVIIRENRVIGNDSMGVAINHNIFAALDPRIEPFPDQNQVKDNVIVRNGRHPDTVRMTALGALPADILYDGTGVGTCFEENVFQTDFPEGIVAAFSCDEEEDDDDDDD